MNHEVYKNQICHQVKIRIWKYEKQQISLIIKILSWKIRIAKQKSGRHTHHTFFVGSISSTKKITPLTCLAAEMWRDML